MVYGHLIWKQRMTSLLRSSLLRSYISKEFKILQPKVACCFFLSFSGLFKYINGILYSIASSPHNISVERLFTTLRIIGTSNGGVWTSITGVFWGPQHSHFWGVRILRVDSIFPLSWNIVCFAPYPAAILGTKNFSPTLTIRPITPKKNTEALWYRYRYQVQHFQDTNLHKILLVCLFFSLKQTPSRSSR